MKNKYYVFNLLHNITYSNIDKTLNDYNYKKIKNLQNEYNYNIILYRKKPKSYLNSFDRFVIYIKSNKIDSDFINSISKNAFDNIIDTKTIFGNKTFSLYFIIDTENLTIELKKFIKYGSTSLKVGYRYCSGKIQVPIVINSKENKLYVGYYNGLHFLSPGMQYKQTFDILLEKMKNYYNDYNSNINSNVKIIRFSGKKKSLISLL